MKIETEKKRRPYQKPEIEGIKLVVEEIMFDTCKTGGAVPPMSGLHNCNPSDCQKQQPS